MKKLEEEAAVGTTSFGSFSPVMTRFPEMVKREVASVYRMKRKNNKNGFIVLDSHSKKS